MSKMIALVGLTAVVLTAAAQGAIQAQTVTYKNATPEQLALHGLKASVNTSVWNASLTPELRSERARNAALSVPREQRLLNSAKANVAQKAYWDSKKAKA